MLPTVATLVDTGAWYALADTSDRHHRHARVFYLDNIATGRLLTTDLILAETLSLLTGHLGRAAAQTFWGRLRQVPVHVLAPVDADLEAAWRIGQAYPDQTFSFVDCVSFAIMERLGITDVFAFDTRFLVYRFGVRRERAFRRLPARVSY